MTYETITHQLDISGLAIKVTHITNFDDLLNAFIEKGEDNEAYQDQQVPYWADLWHAAIALSEYLVKEVKIDSSTTVTELGCGLGLPGIVAGKLGAKVTLTDYLPEAVDFCKLNWEQNNAAAGRFELLDWRTPNTALSADILLASDVAYETRSFAALERTIEVMVPVGGKVIISEPSREMAKPFLQKLRTKKGFHVKSSTIKIHWDNFDKVVNIIELERL